LKKKEGEFLREYGVANVITNEKILFTNDVENATQETQPNNK